MNQIQEKNVAQVIQDGMMEFSAYVLLNRAIPDLRDGLKPVYRRILYTMYKMKATTLTKSANVSGQVMKIHPHGNSYGTAVGMVQKDRHLIPFLEGKGNFGSYTSRDLAEGADRYTEMKLAPISVEMMKNFNKNIVKFVPNYDGTIMMPEVLPVKYPSILTFAQSGIGVGFSNSMVSFNFKEVCSAVSKYIKTGRKTYLIPDFATGGIIEADLETIKSINLEGSGSVRIRGNGEIDGNKIIITEIPYGTTREAIIDKIVALNKSGKLKEVSDVKDSTGRKGQKIIVIAKRGTDMTNLLGKLYRYTPLEATYSANMNVIDLDGLPRVLGVWPIIDQWLSWRREVIKNELIFDINKIKDHLQFLYALRKILVDIEKAIEIIRHSKESEIETNLSKEFDITIDQAQIVSNMKLRNLNKTYIETQIKMISDLENEVKDKQDHFESEDRINQTICDDLSEMSKKFSIDRRTTVVKEFVKFSMKKEKEEIKKALNYPVKLILTEQGYAYKFKKLDEDPVLVPGDKIKQEFMTENSKTLMIFSKDNYIYRVNIQDIEDTNPGDIGKWLSSQIRFSTFDYITSYILEDTNYKVVFVYESGRVVAITPESYNRSVSRVKNVFLENETLKLIVGINKDIKIDLTYMNGTTKILDTSEINVQKSRLATGKQYSKKEIKSAIVRG